MKKLLSIIIISIILLFQSIIAFAYDCSYMIQSIKQKEDSFMRIDDEDVLYLLYEIEHKSKRLNGYSDICLFYIGKKFYELSEHSEEFLLKAEINFGDALTAMKSMKSKDRLFLSTVQYLLNIERKKDIPNKAAIKKYVQEIEKLETQIETKEYSENITNSMEKNRKKSHSNFFIKNENYCWGLFQKYQYLNAKNCFLEYLSIYPAKIVNEYFIDTQKKVSFLSRLNEDIRITKNRFSKAQDCNEISNMNIKNIKSFFKEAIKEKHSLYFSLNESHRCHFLTINSIAHGKCLMNKGNYREAYTIFKKALNDYEYLTEDETLELKSLINIANEKNRSFKTPKKEKNKEIITSPDKTTMTINNERSYPNFANSEDPCWKLFKNYQYLDTKKCFEKFLYKTLIHEGNSDYLKKITYNIKILSDFNNDINSIKKSFINTNACYETSSKNTAIIKSFFTTLGKYGRGSFYYPNISESHKHQNHFIIVNAINYGKCLMNTGNLIKAFEVLKDTLHEKELSIDESGQINDLIDEVNSARLLKIKEKGILAFKKFEYDVAIDFLQKYYSKSNDKQVKNTLELISKIKNKKKQLIRNYKDNCQFKTVKSNSDNIINWFNIKNGELGLELNDYPKNISASTQALHLNAINWSTFGQCTDKNEVYINLADILANAEKYTDYLNENEQQKLNNLMKKDKDIQRSLYDNVIERSIEKRR